MEKDRDKLGGANVWCKIHKFKSKEIVIQLVGWKTFAFEGEKTHTTCNVQNEKLDVC